MLTDPILLERLNPQENNSTSSLSQLGEDYQSFLQLLTAQIQNQDPLAPVDSTEFVAQLAQLSQVEQAVQTNERIETLTAQISGLLNLGGTDLLGKEVMVESSAIRVENGQSQTTYELPTGAAEVSAQIIDPTGFVVRTLSGLSTAAGVKHTLGWDGKDALGNQVLDGDYTVLIKAVDGDESPITPTVMQRALVTEVRFEEGELLFGLEGGGTASSITVRSAS